MPQNKTNAGSRREYLREYQRVYRRTHPEEILQNRLRSAARFLTRYGYTVLEPINREGK